MGEQVELRCRCGEVHAVASDLSPATVNRVVCHCDDCQAFVHQIGRADLLDAKGGSDVVQLAPAALVFTKGQHRIVGLRLSPKGLYRWHTTCCNTPVGNTMGPSLPFVGVIAQSFDSSRLDGAIGPPVGAIMGKFAVGEPPPGSTGLSLSLLLRAIGKLIGWRLSGRNWPNPFFSRETREPVFAVTVLPKERRDALRALCGPHPTARA